MFRSVFTAMEKQVGFRMVRASSDRKVRPAELSPEMRSAIENAIPYTMTSPERLAGLCAAVEHVVANEVPGAFVECGVWRGGSSMVTVLSTGYPENRTQFIKGMVEETIPGFAPEQISILRLDTDWSESTKHELIHLFSRLSRNGILIIDDYGHWAGARKAVDEYFASQGMKPFLNRLDNNRRIYVRC